MKSAKRTILWILIISVVLLGVVVGFVIRWVMNQHDDTVYVGAYEQYIANRPSSYFMHSVLDSDIVVKIKPDADSDAVQVPLNVDMTYDADIWSDSEHGRMDMTMKFLTQTHEYKSELYVVPGEDNEYTSYVRVVSAEHGGEVSEWVVTDDNMAVVPHNDLVQRSLFERCVATGDDNYHYITGDSSYLLDLLRCRDILTTILGDFIEEGEVTDEAFNTAIGSAKVTYQFDKDYHLVKIIIDDFSYWTEDVTIDLTWTLEFSNFGEVTLNDVAVPNDVSESAKDMPDVNLFGE